LFGISATAALPLLSFALTYALKGGRSPQAFAIGILPLVFLPVSRHFREAWFSQERSLRPLMMFFLWAAVCLAASPPLYFHLYRLSVFAAYLMFAAAATLWNDREKKIFLCAVLGIGLIESVFFLFLHLGRGASTGHLFGNPIYSALSAGAALLVVGAFAKGGRKSFLIPAAILLTVALALTKSRSTLVGFLVAMAFLAPRRRFFTGIAVLAGGLILIGIADSARLMAYLKVDFARPEDLFGRLTIWRTAIAMSLDHPFFGWGLGNFEAGYLRHQLPVDTALRFDRSTIFAHNDFLQLAAEAGWAGAALGVWALVSFAARVRKRMEDPVLRWTAAVVTLYAVAGLFNFTFFLPYNGLIAAAAFGMGTGGQPVRAQTKAPTWALAWVAVPAFLLVFSLLNGVSESFRARERPDMGARVLPVRADLWYEAAIQTLNSKTNPRASNLASSLTFLNYALRWNPQDAFAWDRLGMIQMAMSSADAPAAFARAIDLAPMHTPFWIDAGFERLRAGDTADALAKFSHAAKLEPNAPLVWFALAVSAQEAGQGKRADEMLEKAIAVRRRYISQVPPSGYATYLFGMAEDQMRATIASGRPGRWSKPAP